MFDTQLYPSFSPCTVHVDLACIRRNLRRISEDASKVMAVVKSDAYGHGLIPVASTLAAEGVGAFAVGTVDEACFLRDAGFNHPVLALLGALHREDMERAAEQHISPLIYNWEGLQLAAGCSSAQKPLHVTIKCETGMGRLGFAAEELPEVVEFLRSHTAVRPVMALSHLACADMPEKEAFTRQQYESFSAMHANLCDAFPQIHKSLCNSAGALAYTAWGGDFLRPGVALYGGNPFYGTAWQHKGSQLEEAMRVSTKVLHVHGLKAGQSLSYGATFVAPEDMRVAVLGVGYADGFSRAFSSRGRVALHGQVAPVCGRVCMGMIMVDVSHIPQAAVGDDAWLAQGGGEVSLHALAEGWGTIVYEVQCLLGRNQRLYV